MAAAAVAGEPSASITKLVSAVQAEMREPTSGLEPPTQSHYE
jgi:hypothetical protein